MAFGTDYSFCEKFIGMYAPTLLRYIDLVLAIVEGNFSEYGKQIILNKPSNIKEQKYMSSKFLYVDIFNI